MAPAGGIALLAKTSLTLAAVLLATAFVPGPAGADHTTFLLAADAATNYGDAVTLVGQLLDTNDFCPGGPPCPVGGRQVDFYVDDAYVGTDVTNAGGFAYLLLTAAPSWHAGDHSIRVQYDRSNSPGVPAVATSVLTIRPEVTVVDAQAGYLRATIADDDGAALGGKSVRFTVTDPQGGVHDICTAVSDATGNAQCTGIVGAGLNPAGLLQYEARFDGTGDYVGDTDAAYLI